MIEDTTIKTDLAILGAGLTGLCASVFATNRGIDTFLAGQSIGTGFASGLMDLLGELPGQEAFTSPWTGIKALRKNIPGHPYAKISDDTIKQSFGEIRSFLDDQGLSYHLDAKDNNIGVITSLGSLKKSYMIPSQMWNGVLAHGKKARTLLVDFAGLKMYSSKQIAATLGNEWPGLETLRVQFPGTERLEEVHGERLARSLDLPEGRKALAEKILPFVGDAEYVGFPAVLGMYRTEETVRELSQLLGRPVFEIPMPPVSVPGIRLKEAFFTGLLQRYTFRSISKSITQVRHLPSGRFDIRVADASGEKKVEARAVLLATGRFLGRGLTAERTGIRETLMALPVHQPCNREVWHRPDLFDPLGHPVNTAGVETDEHFRTISEAGQVIFENLFSAGAILAHNDWTRIKSGVGVAFSSAFKAVTVIQEVLGK